MAATGEVREAFENYVAVALSRIRGPERDERPDDSHIAPSTDQKIRMKLNVVPNADLRLRITVDRLEKTAEFQKLVTAVRTALPSYEFEIKNFFRRSGFYSISGEREGRAPTAEALFDRFDSAMRRRKFRYIYLALIESVAFAEDKMDFASFAVRRFTRAELEAELQSGVVRTFYPYAQVDTTTLEDYWFIYAEEEIEESPFRLDRPIADCPPLKRKFTEFPTPIETALRKLALYDSKSWMVDNSAGWFGFNIPFVLAINDNLLDAPNAAPDLDKLHYRPSFDSDGEERGYEPDFMATEGVSEGSAFVNFIAEVESSVARVEGVPEWDFLNHALGYLVKAYFSDGLEQLLWHMTVLDALLGEKGNVTKALRRRVPLILGRDGQERENLRKQVGNLYDLRSELVHGKAMAGHSRERLFEARSLARRTALYFVNFLASIRTRCPSCSVSREKILEMIDIGKSGAPAMAHSLEVLNALPEEFPCVAVWS